MTATKSVMSRLSTLFVQDIESSNMSTHKPVCFVTGNPNKLLEFTSIVGDKLAIISQDLNVPPEIQGTGEEIIAHKARAAAQLYDGPVLVDDTGFYIDALGGAPGPYIKDFLGGLSPAKIWSIVAPQEDHKATAVCMIGYCEPGQEPVIFKGACPGTIVEPRGGGGFGFDSVFRPSEETGGDGRTYAEMAQGLKDKISHRARAVKAAVEFLLEHSKKE